MRILSVLGAMLLFASIFATTTTISSPAMAQDQQAAAGPVTGEALRNLVKDRTWQWGKYIEQYRSNGKIYGWVNNKGGSPDYGGARTSWDIENDRCVDLIYKSGHSSNGCYELTDLGNGKYSWIRQGDGYRNDGVLIE